MKGPLGLGLWWRAHASGHIRTVSPRGRADAAHLALTTESHFQPPGAILRSHGGRRQLWRGGVVPSAMDRSTRLEHSLPPASATAATPGRSFRETSLAQGAANSNNRFLAARKICASHSGKRTRTCVFLGRGQKGTGFCGVKSREPRVEGQNSISEPTGAHR